MYIGGVILWSLESIYDPVWAIALEIISKFVTLINYPAINEKE